MANINSKLINLDILSPQWYLLSRVWNGIMTQDGNKGGLFQLEKREQLDKLLAGYFERGKQTLEMQLPDGPFFG